MKVVINKCYGGFSISLEAARWMAERGHAHARDEVARHEKQDAWIKAFVATGKWPNDCSAEEIKWLEIDAKYRKEKHWYSGHDYERDDVLLVEAVETLGKKANGECAELVIVEIPDGTEYSIEEYDGLEHIAETHRTWG